MQNIEAFKELLSSPKKIVITTHHKPDADALGSSLAMWNYLKQYNHDVVVITPSDYPNFLAWMHGNDEVIIFEENNQKRSEQLVNEADIIFCLDFSSLSRINEMGSLVKGAKGYKVLIDHHLEPEDFADFVHWDMKSAATAELVYDLIEMLGDKDKINLHIAECIYAGILTDTGSFRHPSTTKKVHMTIAELIHIGVNASRVQKLIYDNSSESRLRFLGYALYEKLVVLREYNTAYIAITADELKRFNSVTGDTEGLVNYALSIEGIVMGAVFIDRTDSVKMSFRSVGEFSVNEFARAHFEGGGHKNAAGGKSNLSLEETIQKFLSVLPQYKEKLMQQI
jgi:phosphoesterase RecJ-like protein